MQIPVMGQGEEMKNEFDELAERIKNILDIDAVRDEEGNIYINSALINGFLDKIENFEERMKELEKKMYLLVR